MRDADCYVWRAVYSPDGEDFLQEDFVDGPHQFSEIEQGRLLALMLIPQVDGLPIHALHLSPGMRLIWFRRHAIDSAGDRANQQRTIACFGWQRTIGGQNVKSITAVYPNGATLTTDQDELLTA